MIKIVTDASVNLPPEWVEMFDIQLVPAYVIFGVETFREVLDISTSEVLERLSLNGVFPKTSQPPPADFTSVYRAVLDAHPGATILSLHLTGAGSGIFESARQAAEQLPWADIRVFDTRAFSIAQALMVREAAIMAQVGETVDSVLARLEDMRDRVKTFFVLDTLDYVYQGGRIGLAAHLIGSLLNIKPVLTVRDGVMESFARPRTTRQAFDKLREMAIKAGEGAQHIRMAIGYALRQVDAEKLADDLRDRLDLDVLLVGEIGPALGVHTGPGALGIAWYIPEPGGRSGGPEL